MGSRRKRIMLFEYLDARRLLTVDIDVSILELQERVTRGEEITYEFDVANLGDEAAQCVILEHLPRGLDKPTWIQQRQRPDPIDLDRFEPEHGFTIAASRGTVYAQFTGDVNGDGFDDLLVNEFWYDGEQRSSVSIMFGGPDVGAESYVTNSSRRPQNDEQSWFFISNTSALKHARLGDVNGDGLDDFVVRSDEEPDAFFIVLGRTTWNDYSFDTEVTPAGAIRISAESLLTIRPAGDLNADGFADLIWDTDAKSKVVLTDERFKAGTTLFLDAETTFDFQHGSRYRPRPIGDFNGDGFDDLLLGGRLVSGVSSAESWAGGIPSAPLVDWPYFDAIGDVNGDGFDDIVNSTEIIFGNPSGTVGQTTKLPYGETMSSAGDVNMDGIDDILVGDYLRDSGHVLLGDRQLAQRQEILDLDEHLHLRTIRESRILWAAPKKAETFGRAVFGNGDLNGDGASEVIFSGGNFRHWSSGDPEAYILFGTPRTEGDGSIRHTLRIGVGETIRYSVSGTILANDPTLDITVVATPCAASDHAPEGHISVQTVPLGLPESGQAFQFEVFVTNTDQAHATVVLDHRLSTWLDAASWTRQHGFPRVLSGTHLPKSRQWSGYYWAQHVSLGDIDGDGQIELGTSQHGRYDGWDFWVHQFNQELSQFTREFPSLPDSIAGAPWGVPLRRIGDVNGDGFDDFATGGMVPTTGDSRYKFTFAFGSPELPSGFETAKVELNIVGLFTLVENIGGNGDFDGMALTTS